jgi:hypothetical protein
MGIVVEEADEAILWLELMTESGIVSLAKTGADQRSEQVDGNFCGIAAYRKECGVNRAIARSHNRSML